MRLWLICLMGIATLNPSYKSGNRQGQRGLTLTKKPPQ